MHTTRLKLALLLLGASVVGCNSSNPGGGAKQESTTKSSPALRLTRTIPLPGVGVPATTTDSAAIPGRLDHLAYDAATGRLFIAALEQGSLEVVDLNKGERIKRIEGLKKPQGIAVVGQAGCVVVACGDENAVHVYGLADLAERAVTPVGHDADNVRTDGTNQAYIAFGPDEGPGGIAIYDAIALKKVGQISLAARPESFQFDLRPGSQRIFVNLPGKKRADNDGSIAVVNRSTGQTVATWHLAGAAQNFPMGFDSEHDRVFVASRKPPLLFCLDGKSGAVLGKAPCVADSDDLYYDALADRVVVIGGGRRTLESPSPGVRFPGADAAIDMFQVNDAGSLLKIGTVPTAPHARTGFFVPQRRAIYIVCPPQGTADAKVLEFTLGT
ncbi:MAG TPA: hypothetical protein VFW23_05385 [Tepidisphaeraceae bacterium]|nr:hypothetical protein [Tepidisphaeraceae bacterium]